MPLSLSLARQRLAPLACSTARASAAARRAAPAAASARAYSRRGGGEDDDEVARFSRGGGGGGGGPLWGHPLGHAPVPPWLGTMHATTILSVRKGGRVAVVGDGQVTRGGEVVKGNAVKVRRIGGGGVISGFAGSTADCLALRERLETKLEEHPGQLTRACVELAKEWRTEKYLRRLEAVMLVADADVSLTVTGQGDVMEPADGIIAIGSGGSYALAAARALLDGPLDAMAIADKAMRIAAEMCVYTNTSFVRDSLPGPPETPLTEGGGPPRAT